jgi:hypothetical protein
VEVTDVSVDGCAANDTRTHCPMQAGGA